MTTSNLKLAWVSPEPVASPPDMGPQRLLAALVVTLCDLDLDLPRHCKVHDPNLAGTVLAMFNLDPREHIVANVGNLIFTWAGNEEMLRKWVSEHPGPEIRQLLPRPRAQLRLV